jgi:hypothetical protein
MNKLENVVYEAFKEKVREDYEEFKNLCMTAPVEVVYRWAEEITFRENLNFYLTNDETLSEILNPSECEKIMDKFNNRILYILYLYWEESDFFSYEYDTVKDLLKSLMLRLNSETNYFPYVDDYIFKPYVLPEGNPIEEYDGDIEDLDYEV